LLVIHRKKLFSAWEPDLLDLYLVLNAGLIFIVFSLMVTKLPHYTLPAFPFLTLLLARRWKAGGSSPGYLTELGWGMGIAYAVLTMIFIPLALAHHFTPSPVGELVHETKGALTPDTEFALVDFQEPNAIWEMRGVAKGYGLIIPPANVISFLNLPGPRAVVLSTALWKQLQPSTNGLASSWKTDKARGFNAAKLSPLDLTLVVKP
jgi:hypothetical protein